MEIEEGTIWEKLAEPFPPETIHWRVGSVWERDGKKFTTPLCYVDARMVMQRLDDVLGPENWQDRFIETHKRVLCEIGIYVNEQWIWKSDGAGDTNMEGEKGGLSDAFKRAAVKFGIGRYLYGIRSKPVELNKGKYLPDNYAEVIGISYLPTFTSNQQKTKYYKGLKAAAAEDDALKARELWDELSSEQQIEVWNDLKHSSGVRSTIKRLLEETKE